MVTVAGDGLQDSISSSVPNPSGPEDRPTVGDWLLVDANDHSIIRILDRASLFKRTAPGDDRRVQPIAANVDTLFVVTSCNQDFNVARIERYLVLAGETGVRPVIVLTKADLSPEQAQFVDAALAAGRG
ncbi:GTPase RsgA [Sphingomonas sp. LHG3443-2]|uniref:GTPase RsgA n=1 Tax=Sphingomonas sp. LHG3443-2 TaxID=2804639 RepID=UPI003CF7FB2B